MTKIFAVLLGIIVFLGAWSVTRAFDPELFVVLTSPANGAQIEGLTQITAEASASAGVRNVDFFADGALIASDSAYPFETSWNANGLVPGSYHSLLAEVVDFVGNATQSAVVVVQVAPDVTAPAVAIINPANGGSVPRNKTVVISADATDNYRMARVDFYVDGGLLCSDTTSPYECAWKVPVKKNILYNLAARAVDVFGNNSLDSISVTSH